MLDTIEYLAYSGGNNNGWVFSGMDECLDQTFARNRMDLRTRLRGVAGNSVGSFFALARVCGYTAREFRAFLTSRLTDMNLACDITALFTASSIASMGVISPQIVTDVIHEMLSSKFGKGDMTLSELYAETSVMLTLTAYNVSRCETRVFTHETDPDLPVEMAIRMTTAIPIVFPPVVYQNDAYVDGGVSENIPTRVPVDRAVIMYIQTFHHVVAASEMRTMDFLCRLMHPAHDNEIYFKTEAVDPTMRRRFVPARVPCSFVSSTTDFALTERKRSALINLGYIRMLEALDPRVARVVAVLDAVARTSSMVEGAVRHVRYPTIS